MDCHRCSGCCLQRPGRESARDTARRSGRSAARPRAALAVPLCDVLQLLGLEALRKHEQGRGGPGEGEQSGHGDEAAEQALVQRQHLFAADGDVLQQRKVEIGAQARYRIAPD
jgi:hypothetical protein